MELHIPFCVHAGSWYRRPVITGRNTERLHFYAMALKTELEANASEFSDCTVSAIHLGGGQSSAVEGEDLLSLIKTINDLYDLQKDAPITMQSLPTDISGANVPFFRRARISRYDFWVLSLEGKDFSHLDCQDTTKLIPYVSNIIHADERHNMGFVLLYGKESISAQNFRRSLIAFTRSNAIHLILQRYEGEGASSEIDSEKRLQQARTLLPEQGFHEYLPCRFAKEGCEDRFSSLEAEGTDVISFGMGARTRFEGVETENTMDLKTYFLHSDDYKKITVSAKKI